MQAEAVGEIIRRMRTAPEPVIEFLERTSISGSRVGVFPSSFNPVTNAHIELIKRAAASFHLDETLALAGVSNADKTEYDCALESRLQMLSLALSGVSRVAIGLSSHPYFTDLVAALDALYPDKTEFYFVVGFDTFERVLDINDRYTTRYHRRFSNHTEALRYLLERGRLVVAGRAGSDDRHIRALIANEDLELRERILYMEVPSEVSERSASEIRDRVRAGVSIAGLTPPAVERFIHERGIYQRDQNEAKALC